jgi:hypothetical protein
VTLNEVIARPSHYRDAELTLEGLVADPQLARAPEGRTAAFALVSPKSNMGLAIMGAEPPEMGAYVRVEGPIRLDRRLNTPYVESPDVIVLQELPIWQRPRDHQSLEAAGAILCAVIALAVIAGALANRRPRDPEPSEERFQEIVSRAVAPPPPAPTSPEPTATEPAHEGTAAPAERPAPAAVAMTLEVVSGPDRGQTFDVTGTRVTIGHSQDRDIALNDETVARHQATLTRTNGALVVRSEVPELIVCLNSRPVRQAEIAVDDVIRVGHSELRVVATRVFENGDAPLPTP